MHKGSYFESYKVHFKSEIRIRMKKITWTMTTEDGSMETAWAEAETTSNTTSVTASIDGLVDDRAAIDVAADTAAITSAADTIAVPLSTILPPVTITGWDDEDPKSSSDDDPNDELPLVESSTSDDAFLSGRVSRAVDTIGAKAGPASLGATTTGGGRGLAAFNAFAKRIICSRFFSADRDFGTKGSSAVLVEVVVEAGDDSVTTLSPLVFFFLEDVDCVGKDFSTTMGCTVVSMTEALALTLPGTAERERVWQPGFSGGLEVKKGGSPHGILLIA
jgi:hypothetical protein